MANGLYSSPQLNAYPQSEFIDAQTKRPSRAWQQFFLNLLNFSSSPTASPGEYPLPEGAAGFINITVNGQPFKVPYYNP